MEDALYDSHLWVHFIASYPKVMERVGGLSKVEARGFLVLDVSLVFGYVLQGVTSSVFLTVLIGGVLWPILNTTKL